MNARGTAHLSCSIAASLLPLGLRCEDEVGWPRWKRSVPSNVVDGASEGEGTSVVAAPRALCAECMATVEGQGWCGWVSERVGVVYFNCWGLGGGNKGLVLAIRNKLKRRLEIGRQNNNFSPFCLEQRCSPQVKRVVNAGEWIILTVGVGMGEQRVSLVDWK